MSNPNPNINANYGKACVSCLTVIALAAMLIRYCNHRGESIGNAIKGVFNTGHGAGETIRCVLMLSV